VVGSCDCHTGGQENSGVKKGHLKGVEGKDSGGGSATSKLGGWGKASVVEGSEEAQEKEYL